MPPQSTDTGSTQAPNPAPAGAPASPKGNIMAIFAYLGILIIIPFVTDAKNDPFVKFHLRQGIVLIISWVVQYVLFFIPVLGWIVGFILMIFNIVATIIGIVNVVTGKEKELPIIGKYAKNFNF